MESKLELIILSQPLTLPDPGLSRSAVQEALSQDLEPIPYPGHTLTVPLSELVSEDNSSSFLSHVEASGDALGISGAGSGANSGFGSGSLRIGSSKCKYMYIS